KLVPPADNHDTTSQIIPSTHGTNGAIEISMPGTLSLLETLVYFIITLLASRSFYSLF
ncbi:hypothetical protein BDQ17DRAFT_1242088, partial [Cyathus striatus]